MSLHAIDALEDALEDTRDLLWPPGVGRWVRLSLLALFVGGPGGLGWGGGGGSAGGTGGTGGVEVPLGVAGVPEAFSLPRPVPVLFVLALAAVVVALALGYLLVGSILEFVLVESLARREVRIRQHTRAHLRDGLSLFGFRVGLWFLAALAVAGVTGLTLLLAGPGPRLVGLVLGVPFLLVLLPVLLVVDGFTTVFVVPIVAREGCGVLAGWRRLWAVLRGGPLEYGAYLVVSVVLGGVGAALVGSVVGLVAGIALLPVGAALLGLGALGLPPLLLIVLVPFLLVALAVLLALSAVASVPVVAYLRYYALSVLGRTSRYDLRPSRPAVRRIGGDRPSDVG